MINPHLAHSLFAADDDTQPRWNRLAILCDPRNDPRRTPFVRIIAAVLAVGSVAALGVWALSMWVVKG